MKTLLKLLSILLVIGLCGLTIYGFIWIRQYQALAEEEPEVTFAPGISDITHCTMGDFFDRILNKGERYD